MRNVILAMLLLTAGLGAQVKDFDFYRDIRTWLFTLPAVQRQPLDALLERYRQRLNAEGVANAEILPTRPWPSPRSGRRSWG